MALNAFLCYHDIMKTTEYHSVWERRKAEEKRRKDLAIEKAKVMPELHVQKGVRMGR